jgi:hydrogenase/urease accessory protein HupE
LKRKISYILIFALLIPASLTAHELRPAYLQIQQTSDSTYAVFWRVPQVGFAVPQLSPVFSDDFDLQMVGLPRSIGDGLVVNYVLKSQKSMHAQAITIDGLPRTMIDVLVNMEYLDGSKAMLMLQPDNSIGVFPNENTSGKSDVIKNYTTLGIEHILFGIDHLLFVLALIIITSGFSKIVKTVTAFTLAHSITLSLAVLGVVNFPSPPVEAVIALSIVFLAVEIVKNTEGKQSLTRQKPWIVAFIFGLLHGFGFAGALSEMGLPPGEIPLALAFFNIGVELGQLAFVFAVLAAIRLIAIKKDWPIIWKKVPAYAIGSIAAFWMIGRIAAFWQ